MKKVLHFLCIIVVMQLIGIACCPDAVPYYIRLHDIEATSCALYTPLGDSTTSAQRDFRIRISLKAETFAQVMPLWGVLPSAKATSCPDDFRGLQSDITYCTLTCSHDALTTAAGEPIAEDKFSIYSVGFTDDAKNDRISIQEWLRIMNTGGYLLAYNWYIEFKEAVQSDSILTFTMHIKQEDGSEFTATTNPVRVQ